VGGRAASTTVSGASVAHQQIIFQVPPGEGANQSVLIVVSGQNNTVTNIPLPVFSYDIPTVESAAPALQPTLGNQVTSD